MASSGKAKERDTTPQVEEEHVDHSESGSEDDEEVNHTLPEASTPSTSSNKKKKKRSKAIKALNALRGGGKDKIPQELVDVVLDKVKTEHGDTVPSADEATVRAALEQMKIKDVIQGKTGMGGKNKKDVGTHKFWGTQPVPQLGEEAAQEDGYIEPPKPPEELRQDPYPLPKEFVWATLDLADDVQLRELWDLLSANYVEDDDASFRFQYSAEFLRWALQPPGYVKEWHVAVRVASNKKLVAFVSAVPITLRVRAKYVLQSVSIL